MPAPALSGLGANVIPPLPRSLGPAKNNLEVIARQGEQLVSFSRAGATLLWQGPFGLAAGVAGTPVLIQNIR
jgi:hypothetical protein